MIFKETTSRTSSFKDYENYRVALLSRSCHVPIPCSRPYDRTQRDKLTVRKFLYYISNGSSQYDVKQLDGVDNSFKIKNIIVSTTRHLPPNEDEGKVVPLKTGATCNKNAQHRGEKAETLYVDWNQTLRYF